jgi:gamma-glutamyltranspeptidase/glutathione hydrolase
MRLAFADTRWYVADPAFNPTPLEWLLSKDYAAERRKLIHLDHASLDQEHGAPTSSSDTVYLTVVDAEGNACSFINSNYMGFGTGIVPSGWGFTLQNRGLGFSFNPLHPNALTPGKRLATPSSRMITPIEATSIIAYLLCQFCDGGSMVPQGHMQVVSARWMTS